MVGSSQRRFNCMAAGMHLLLCSFPDPGLSRPPQVLWLKHLFPLRSWPRLTRTGVRDDALAGVVGAVLVLPQGVAFAALAGLPPEYGLYCAMLPTIVAALWGSSWHAVTGPTNAVSLVVFATLAPLALPGSAQYVGLALTLAFMSGVLLLALGVLRLGSLTHFVSHTVVVGFTAGAACLIAASQLNGFFGLDIPAGGSLLQTLYQLTRRLEGIQGWVVLVGVSTVLAGVLCKRLAPRTPYMIFALLAGAAAAWLVNSAIGPDSSGIAMLSPLPSGLPPLSRPVFSLQAMQSLLAISLSITVLLSTEAVSIGRALAARTGQRYDPNQELIGQGLANLSASFFSGYPAAASFNRSGANYEAGAKTPLAAVFSALFLAVMVMLLAPLAAYLPYASLAGLLMLVAWGIIDWHAIRHILATSRSETAVLAVTLAATLMLSLEIAILFGVMASLIIYLNRTSHPAMRSLVPDPTSPERKMVEPEGRFPECPQLKLLRIEGSIYFGAVPHVEQHLEWLRETQPGRKHLLVMSKSINFIDMAGADLLLAEVTQRRRAGGDVYFYSLRKSVEELLARGGYLDVIGRDHLFRGKREAIERVYQRLDPDVCRTCPARIFLECAAFTRQAAPLAARQETREPR